MTCFDVYAWITFIHAQICVLSDSITSGNRELLFRSHNQQIYEEDNKSALERLGRHGTFKSRELWTVRDGKGINLSNMFGTISLYKGSLMLPRKFFTNSLNAFHAPSSILVIVSVKLSSIISLRICGPSNIPSLILACDNEENFVHKYWKHGLFLSNAFTKCFIIPSLMCKGGSRMFSLSTRLTFETFLDPACSCPFRANVQYPNVCPWPCYPTRIGNRDILCSLFVAPLYLHPNLRRAHLIAFLEGVCYECTRKISTTI